MVQHSSVRAKLGFFRLSGIIVALLVSACVSANDSARLPYPVQRALLNFKIPEHTLSVYIQEVGSTQPLLNVAAAVPRNPASVIKLVTTFVALAELGPAFRWKTTASATARLRDGHLEGDLYLRGGGDPYLVTERLWKFLFELRQTGVKHIAGDLVIDNSYFDAPPGDRGAFDGRPHRPYNVEPQATLVNFGVTRFWLVPNAGINSVSVEIDPPSTTLRVDNDIVATSDKCGSGPTKLSFRVIDTENGGHVRFQGPYPLACGRYSLTRAVSQGPAQFFGSFKALWLGLGGSIDGGVRLGEVPANARKLHSFKSPPLGEVVRIINKYSNNVMTRHLLLTLDAEHEPPGTVEGGRHRIAQWLASNGLDLPELVVDNGAGLSRETRITARGLARLLLHAHGSPLMPELIASLPMSAVDGTLEKRFEDHPIARSLHVKTGTIDDVRAIAGYLAMPDGRMFVIVSLHNHPGIQYGTGTAVQDVLLEWLYTQ